ncbi:TIGR03618 family F420-dependent PPOX class oxidoreductase [Gordonia humi]|uniref:PPOX class probable F420-dependent enzyme n=1 Tax=Gordonia humi TaxID=686429 RepID=A0A840F3U0_9ACTN|nr:TIGR03618 family F420-dependent PPOX class oxidoreductase [Gordonia humi]MBB4136566.1 PPOX class probable F420-dependent enzyme [Gordonia humi]
MPRTLADLSPAAHAMLTERHLGSIATLRRDGTPHVCPIGFTVDLDAGLARVITSGGNQKAVNAARGAYASLSHVDGARWITVEGPARVLTDATSVRDAEDRYAARYKAPRENPKRVVIEVTITRVMGARSMFVER